MYENFYRFKEKPFSLTPDPKFLYLSKQYQGALDHMLYGIKQREGFMVIAGDVRNRQNNAMPLPAGKAR